MFAQKIYTQNGVTKENIFTNGERVLHIGSGSNKLPGTETVDILDLPNVDKVHDLDEFPWPYEENSFDLVFGHNVFEHLDNQVASMEELWRILKPGGRLLITVPYFRSVDAFNDSTHEHFFTSASMKFYLDEDNQQAGYHYTDKQFKEIGFWYGWPQPSKNPVVKIFKSFIKNHSWFYDQYLSLLFPVQILVWELEAIKGKRD